MKRIILTLIGIAVVPSAIATHVLAVPHTVTLSANVPSSCTVTASPTISGTGFSANPTIGASAFTATTANQVVQPTNGTISFPVACNGGNIKVALAASPMTNPASASSATANRIDFTAEAKIDNLQQVVMVSTSGTASSFGNAGAANGEINVKITTLATPSGKTLVAGGYSGSLQINIDPI
jgi:hypothetical protein